MGMAFSDPISQIAFLAIDGISIFAVVEISPIIRTIPVVQQVSQATRPFGS